MKYLSKSVVETGAVALSLVNKLKEIKSDKAVSIGLFGDLGSGKTTFTQALGKILGVAEVMTSPTFVIEKRYDLDGAYGFKKLIHIDAYRLDSDSEILNLNFQEDLNNPDNLILIEWPERVSGALPENIIRVNFKFVSEFEREIDVV
jgi:tRNA threonylcarbamoyladenosine biosynthesis protein TsaE